ncbi:uncharacterized protein LOC107788772 isoform X1 [Nicotiana tabacum]|uniref:Large ribosomal subunit protein bL32m n=2 Tax=Nicotiana TaxID=4085 RepID=A0A1S3ZNM0_TOBAC|nr:PREDICTED: uncharacterized protein LOC104215238 isoform X2 [Nicotiana sylvestris]XP_016465971.1 PREDICTED: uncharacterized protein LOC107788772 isoform X2 [Nicotiana tabacum]
MALSAAMLRTGGTIAGVNSGLRRFLHITARPSPLDSVVNQPTATSPSLVLPENDNKNNSNSNIGYMFPNSPVIGGSMELMAVPKKKVSPHKRGIRNGPKALKPIPVIIRCNTTGMNNNTVDNMLMQTTCSACGRVKLPHFFCCSGIKQNLGEENNSAG